MAVVKKISELTPKGANLANNDLLIVGVSNGTDYDLKSVTGAELLSTAVSQTITNGVTTTAPSQDAVYDALQNKVDKVTGSRLITSAEGTILSNTSGTNTGDETSTTIKSKLGITTLSGSNTGDQDLQQVTDKGNTTTNGLISNVAFSVKTNLNQILGVIKRNTTNTAGELLIADTSGNATTYKINEITKGVNSIVLPSSSGTLALTSDLSSYAQTSQVVTLTGNQTVGGIKTFTNETKLNDKLYLKETATPASLTGYTTLTSNGNQIVLQNGNSTGAATLQFNGAGTYTFPASNGTLATTSDLNSKVDANSAITGATKTKITYDSKGLVTAGADATTADIADSLNKRYVTDANLTTLSNTSGTNTGDQIISDATLTTSDITTNNVSTTKHGFVPKAPNNTTQFLRGDGTWATPSAGGLTYFTEAQNTSAPNATVPVDSLTAVSATTDADIAILPKGAGALISQIPDNTTTGGNKRGARAVDFQRSRAGASQVASGADSAILSGINNVASNTYGVVLGGSGNFTSAQYTLAFGRNSYITGNYAFEFGNNGGGTADGGFGFLSNQTGSNAVSFHGAATGAYSFTKSGTASGQNSVAFSGTSSGAFSFTANALNLSNGRASSAFGESGSTKGVATRLSLACTQDIPPYLAGNSQVSIGAVTTQTTTNNAISLLTYNGTAIALPLQNNEAIRVKGSIIGKQTATTNVCCYDFDCVIVRGTTAASTVIKINNMNLVFDDIVCTVLPTLNADTTNGGLDIKSGGKTTTTIKWCARIDSTESILA